MKTNDNLEMKKKIRFCRQKIQNCNFNFENCFILWKCHLSSIPNPNPNSNPNLDSNPDPNFDPNLIIQQKYQ